MTIAGQFTGHTGAKVLTQAELSLGVQAWAKQDQFDKAVLDNTSSEEQSDDKLVVGEEEEYFLYEQQQHDHKQTFSPSFNSLVCW